MNKKQRVLEVGCGTGTTALKLSKHVKSYVASDIAPKMSEIGGEKANKAKVKNVEFHTGTLFSEDLKKGSFDVIMAHNLFHLVRDRDKAMRRVNELLKPKGLFISKTPCLGEKKSMKVIAPVVQVVIGPLKSFTLNEYRGSVLRSGFEIEYEHVYDESVPRVLMVGKKK